MHRLINSMKKWPYFCKIYLLDSYRLNDEWRQVVWAHLIEMLGELFIRPSGTTTSSLMDVYINVKLFDNIW